MERRRHATSFGAAAAAYAEHRPDYAEAAVRWALDPAPGRRVLDLGAGTGKLTATLVALGFAVTVVEPDPAMLAELRRTLPDVRARPGHAEAIPLPDASVDAVVAGNALHWFDMAVAGPEIARVLVPGGVLAGLWNVVDDRVGWVAGLARAGGSAVIGPRDTPTGWRAETAEVLPPRFGAPERAGFPHGQRRTAGSLVAALATRAGVLVMPPPERENTLDRIRAFLAREPETADGEFTLPMLTCVLRGRSGYPSGMDDEETRREFGDSVNMTAKQLDDWLGTDESKAAGQHNDAESIGHRSGRRIVEILRKKKDDLTGDDLAHMRKVVGYVHRHLAQRPSGDVKDTTWRHSLMNWGHDPLH